MQPDSFSVTLSYPDGASVTLAGQGAIVYAADGQSGRLAAVTGSLTLGDVAQLMLELTDAFGAEEISLALGLALITRRMEEEAE